MIEIREETLQDIPAIRAVNDGAFGGPAEALLVERLRAAGNAILSLVATLDGLVVGHILFSPITIEKAPDNFRGAGLAPMSVLPEFQNSGIGSRLVNAGLEGCRQEGYDIVVVLGHPHYYPRFGFLRAIDYGLANEYGASGAFMVLELKSGVLENLDGLVKYGPEFQGL